MSYQSLKALKKELRCNIPDLIVLAKDNDPFYMASKGQMIWAEWFTEIWERFGFGQGTHLRRVHYRIVNLDPPLTKPNGEQYKNENKDWAALLKASKTARYLRMVPKEDFIDRQSPAPLFYADYEDDGLDRRPHIWVEEADGGAFGFTLPSMPTMPSPCVGGYGGNLQRYHLEVWIEKSTQNDVLVPLCRKYGMNLITGKGELSITAVVELLERVRMSRRPARLFYVSDFDPAGDKMPVSIARKIEFLAQGDGLDIRLEQIALTKAQVKEYKLPRDSIKHKQERGKKRFEEKYGEGAVELDALEGLFPGKLAEILTGHVLRYYDTEVDGIASDMSGQAQTHVWRIRQEILNQHEARLDALGEKYHILSQYVKKELEALETETEDLQEDIRDRLNFELSRVKLSEFPRPTADVAEEHDNVLFDSARAYLDQLWHYKQRQRKQAI